MIEDTEDTDDIVVLNGIVYIKDVNTNTFFHGFIKNPLPEKYTRENVKGNVRNITPDSDETPFENAKKRVKDDAKYFKGTAAARQLFKSKTKKSEGRVVAIGGKRYIVGEKKTKKSKSKKSKSKKSVKKSY